MARPVKFTHRNGTPESDFRRACIKWLKLKFGHRIFHERNQQSMGSTPGRPDDEFLFMSSDPERPDPIPVFIEFKAPGGRLGPRQIEYHDRLRSIRARIHIVRSIEELEDAVADLNPVQLGMQPCKLGGLPHD